MKTTLFNLPIALPLVAILLFPAPAQGATAVEAWVRRYDGPANNDDGATAVAVDGGGNVFVTGYSFGVGSDYDFATIKYSCAGVPLWTNCYNGPGNGDDEAIALAVDGNGDVIVTGSSVGSAGNYDYTTIKYSSAGMPLWTNRYNGPGNGDDFPAALVVDGHGDVCATGYSLTSANNFDYATIKYSSAGAPLWTNRYNGPGASTDQASAITVDGSDNVFVTGSSRNSTASHDFDYATVKYSSGGVPLWTNRYNGPGNNNDYATAVAVNGSGNAFVTGRADGGGGNPDYATIAYSSAGVPLWTNLYNGPGNGTDRGTALAVDGTDSVYVTGISTGSGYDYATIAYSSAGMPRWTNRFSGPGNNNDSASAVGVDGGGNVFVTGSSYGDYATLAYSKAGTPLWTNWYDGPANGVDTTLSSQALAIAGGGTVVLVGTSDGAYPTSTNADYAIVKYVSPPVIVGVSSIGVAARQATCLGALGSQYVAEFATNLSTSPWVALSTNIPGTRGFWTVTDSTATNAQRFYRLLAR